MTTTTPTTLVSEVRTVTDDGVSRMHDVPTRIIRSRYTTIEFAYIAGHFGVFVRLTEGERIALIEALGGHA